MFKLAFCSNVHLLKLTLDIPIWGTGEILGGVFFMRKESTRII